MFFGKKWFNYALLAMIIVTLIDLIKKYILDKKMVNTDELIIYSAMFVGIFGFLHFLSNQNCRSIGKINKNLFFILFFCGILGYLFNICFTKSIFLYILFLNMISLNFWEITSRVNIFLKNFFLWVL